MLPQRQPVFHTGKRHQVSTAGVTSPREATLPSVPLRETLLPRLLHDARSALPILALACVLREKRCTRTPCPLHAAYQAAGGRRSRRATARASGGQGVSSTAVYNRAKREDLIHFISLTNSEKHFFTFLHTGRICACSDPSGKHAPKAMTVRARKGILPPCFSLLANPPLCPPCATWLNALRHVLPRLWLV